METGFAIRTNEYYDSVFLMGVNKRLSEQPGVIQTAVLMASEANKRLLGDIGVSDPAIESAGSNDMVVAVVAETSQAVAQALGSIESLLTDMAPAISNTGVTTLVQALNRVPAANLALISVPGEHATAEARRALEHGLNVFIFSSNVPVGEEIGLKQAASLHDRLVMGPDCGTSIINGVGVGFSNVVRRGTIGVVGPSGTGLQEFTTLVHHAGGGISHAIGTGSRDLSKDVGGLTTLQALAMLEADPATSVLAIIAKPPAPETLGKLVEQTRQFSKPLVGCFLCLPDRYRSQHGPIRMGRTIDDAAALALKAAAVAGSRSDQSGDSDPALSASESAPPWDHEAGFVRGIFAGGTFCYQAQQVFADHGLAVYSNAPLDPQLELKDPDTSQGHCFVDMGDEHFTLGRPHPMIDSRERARRIMREAADPQVGVLLMDFVLGHNASPDPVGELLESLIHAADTRKANGNPLMIVASICGTQTDPQDLALQRRLLQDNGIAVFGSNAAAAAYCAQLVGGVGT